MTENSFKNMLAFLSARPKLCAFVNFSTKFVTYFMYIFYPLFIGYLTVANRSLPLEEIFIPLCGFIALSIIRKLINAPRPYEKFDIAPLTKKDTKGVSFPSRHTFSAFIIAFCALLRFPLLGSALLILATALGVCRVLLGVHFIKDVVAGFLFALFSAGFFLVF